MWPTHKDQNKMNANTFSSYVVMFSYMSPTTVVAIAEDLAVHTQDEQAQQLLSMALGHLAGLVGYDEAFIMVSKSTLPSSNDVVNDYTTMWLPYYNMMHS